MHPTALTARILRSFIECGGLKALTTDILRVSTEVDPEEHWNGEQDCIPSIDCRIRYYAPHGFQFLAGDSSYDQDHRGYWASGHAWEAMTFVEAETMAREMLAQVLDHAAQNEGE
jgi:hypothetical protein